MGIGFKRNGERAKRGRWNDARVVDISGFKVCGGVWVLGLDTARPESRFHRMVLRCGFAP